jgi:hypothetical protein
MCGRSLGQISFLILNECEGKEKTDMRDVKSAALPEIGLQKTCWFARFEIGLQGVLQTNLAT